MDEDLSTDSTVSNISPFLWSARNPQVQQEGGDGVGNNQRHRWNSSSLFGYEKRRTIFLGENNVSESLATSRTGLIFTLNLHLKIGPDDSETQFFLFLSPTFVYVMLHDPNFFILNDNPYGLPTVITVFDAATMYSHYHRIALSEVHELDIPTDPCNDDPSYNFNSCVRSSVTKKVNKMFLPVFGI